MISTKRAMTVILEPNPEKRNTLVDKLSEEDAKYLLKQCLNFLRPKDTVFTLEDPQN